MSDPLLGIGTAQFEIGGYAPTGFRIISPVSMTDVIFNLYNVLDELIPDTVVGYPDLTQGAPYTFSGLNDNSTYYFQAVGPSSSSYKYQIITGPTAPSVISLPTLTIITDQNSPNLTITQNSFDVIWTTGENSDSGTTYSLVVEYQLNSTTPPTSATIPLTTSPQTITSLGNGVVVSGGMSYKCSVRATNSEGITFDSNFVSIETFPRDVTNLRIEYPYLFFNDSQQIIPEFRVRLLNSDNTYSGISFNGGGTSYPDGEIELDRYFMDLRNFVQGIYYSESPPILANTSYGIQVFTRNGNFGYNTSPGVQLSGSFLTLPTAVTQLLTDSITSTGATLSWISPGETGVTYSLQLNGVDLGSQTSPYIFTGLAGNTKYDINILATNATGSVTSSISFSTPPSIATDLSTSNITYNSCDISWISPGETDVNYSVQVLDSNGDVFANLGVQSSPYTITGLVENTTYNYNIISYNTFTDSSSVANGTSFTTLTIAQPTKPSEVEASNITATSFDISWTSPDTSGVSFHVIRDPDTTNYLYPWLTSGATITDGIAPNTSYTIVVRALRTDNQTIYTDSDPFTVLTLPTAASISSVDTITQTGSNVNWNSPQETGVTYRLIASVKSDGSDPVTSIAATSSSQALSGLSANTSYYLFIRATNTSGTTTSSSYPLLTSPNTPTGVTVSNVGATSCDVTWTAGDSDVSFNIIQLSNDDGTTVINALAYNVTSPYSLSGLTSNSLYTIAIQSTNASGSVQSSTVPFTTLSPKSIAATFSHTAKAINTNVDVTITLKNDDGSTNTSEDASTITVSDGTSNFTVTYSEANGYACVLNSETVGAVTYTISHAVFGTTSGSITWNNGGGGGGSGGGGGNNTGNDHNNMPDSPPPAVLHWQDATLADAVSQATDITLMGETSVAPFAGTEVHQTIEVSANLDSLISYSGAYNGDLTVSEEERSFPMVTVNPTAILGAAVASDGQFRDPESDKLTTLVSGELNDDKTTLQGLFKNYAWEYPSDGIFAGNLPIEAVKKVDRQELVCRTLSTIFGAQNKVDNTASSYPVRLFEGALASGKILAADLKDASAAGSAKFEAGDSFSIYVTYTLSKTRTYVLETLQGGGVQQIKVGDVTVTAASTLTESPTPKVHVVRWKFNHAA